MRRKGKRPVNAARMLSALRVLLRTAPLRAPALVGDVWRARSQHWQDLFVLGILGRKRNGYFVEFGAADGVNLSNTYLLEKRYGWAGIAAEPVPRWHSVLRRTRKCHVETKCVWSRSGLMLPFKETPHPLLSTVESFSSSDLHAKNRQNGKVYDVETISLVGMLEKFGAPATIDYLSIDTEGSEFEILNAFDFGRYRFRVITCEHNNTRDRPKMFALLAAHGYQRRFESVSQCDDWYVHRDALRQ